MKRVWILCEGSQGHVVQSRGLARELAKVVNLQVDEIPARLVVPSGFVRPLVKRLLHRWHWDWLFRITHSVGTIPVGKPDLLIASGPRAMLALEHLSQTFGCPAVFVQGTVEVPENTFTAVMRPFEGQTRGDFIFIPLLFTDITPELVDAAANDFLTENSILPKGPVNTLLIGASSAKIRFSQDDWIGIIRMVNDLWKRDGSQWLIATSSRTGRELEELLRNGIDPAAILEAVWYSHAPRKATKAFLGLADRVFVTLDSLTMLTEAVASGRPTCALCPAGLSEERSNTHLQYTLGLAANGFISRTQPGRETEPPPMPPAAPVDYSGAIRELIARLQWNA
ncbi:MAG TPA: ELM1/GtrOC1 family putative glycosyltransferase [Luteolibacter sp.]